jgi:predicted ArsR family transcriptional regulator
VSPNEPAPVGALRERILNALQTRPVTSKSLASMLDVKELWISRELSALAHEGLVDADDPPPPCGRSEMIWRRTHRAAA